MPAPLGDAAVTAQFCVDVLADAPAHASAAALLGTSDGSRSSRRVRGVLGALWGGAGDAEGGSGGQARGGEPTSASAAAAVERSNPLAALTSPAGFQVAEQRAEGEAEAGAAPSLGRRLHRLSFLVRRGAGGHT